ncbi:hypothetical protein C8Q76DRAFT_732027 [Earliella scabrosa]|nr:hypothetical protein C8Q76DRAFT_732027 [Earliella scabrosa]
MPILSQSADLSRTSSVASSVTQLSPLSVIGPRATSRLTSLICDVAATGLSILVCAALLNPPTIGKQFKADLQRFCEEVAGNTLIIVTQVWPAILGIKISREWHESDPMVTSAVNSNFEDSEHLLTAASDSVDIATSITLSSQPAPPSRSSPLQHPPPSVTTYLSAPSPRLVLLSCSGHPATLQFLDGRQCLALLFCCRADLPCCTVTVLRLGAQLVPFRDDRSRIRSLFTYDISFIHI